MNWDPFENLFRKGKLYVQVKVNGLHLVECIADLSQGRLSSKQVGVQHIEGSLSTHREVELLEGRLIYQRVG